MKNPESPRSYLPKLTEQPAPEEREEKRLPRYVEVPALREHGFGPRNLFWGVFTFFLALVLLGAALFLAGPKSALSLGTALLTFTALFVLARLHIFRQRNGAFLALAITCLLGAAIPLAETGFFALKGFAARTAPAAPATVASAAEASLPLLTQSFALSKPDGPGKLVKVLKDSPVSVGGRSFLIKAGDLFPFVEASVGEASFAVRDLQLALPLEVVEVIDPGALAKGVTGGRPDPEPAGKAPRPPATPAPLSAEDLSAITQSAQREAIRRYPALGVKDSLENAVFVSTYQQLKQTGGTDFFANPEWPIELAELLAKREGWARGGAPMTTGPAPVLDAPNDPPADPLDTPVPPAGRGTR